MRTLSKARYIRIAGLAVGAVAVAGAAIAITASAAGMTFGFNRTGAPQAANPTLTANDAASSSSACAGFMKHFAVDISKSQAEINAAYQKAISETLTDEVNSGQLTQTQANSIKTKLAGQGPCNLPSTHQRAPVANKGTIAAYMQQYVAASATALGITDAQLKSDLASGQTLSQVAAAQHVTEADFRTRLIANLKPALDQAVTNKAITAPQEQSIVTRLQTGPLPLWNTSTKKPKPVAPVAPTAGPTPA